MDSQDQEGGQNAYPPDKVLGQDFSKVLLDVIEATMSDPAQHRNLVYEMARVHLQRHASHRNPPMDVLELRRMMLALETAIERVETLSARHAITTTSQTPPGPIPLDQAGEAEQAAFIEYHPAQSALLGPLRQFLAHLHSGVPYHIRAVLRVSALAALAAIVVIVADREFHVLGPPAPAHLEQTTASVPAPVAVAPAPTLPSPAPPPSPALPIPAAYGVYAVSGGTLFELQPLVGRVPDERVFMSATIKTPGRAILPNGKVRFIVYRRDIATSAPDRVTVRVVAKVDRAMTFTKGGQATTTVVNDAWAIRNISFEYRVAPSAESPEMIVITPQDESFTLSPGRYGLVIKGIAYDFIIDGRVRDAAQCLERTEAANGTFYSECRHL